MIAGMPIAAESVRPPGSIGSPEPVMSIKASVEANAVMAVEMPVGNFFAGSGPPTVFFLEVKLVQEPVDDRGEDQARHRDENQSAEECVK